jgi:diacylglycerol kinase family enzyme
MVSRHQPLRAGSGLVMNCLVIVNEQAGPVKRDTEFAPTTLRTEYAKAGVAADVQVVAACRLEETLRAAAKARPDSVVVGGGDGSLRCAAAVLAGTGIPMGVLPLGTLNHFARDLRIPTEPKAAVTALATSVARAVDLGEVNGCVFINNCSLGAYAEAVRRRDLLRTFTAQGKWRAMARASWQTFRQLELLRLHLAVGGGPTRVIRTPLAVVGNNRYSGHLFSQYLRPRLDEGRLWIYTVHAHQHLAVLRLMIRSLVRRLDDVDALSAISATELSIDSLNGLVPAALDGEAIDLHPPLSFRIRPRELSVLVPRDDRTRE